MYIIILKLGFVNVKIIDLGLSLYCTKNDLQICAKRKKPPGGAAERIYNGFCKSFCWEFN